MSLKKILVVDDEEHIRNLFGEFFTDEGYEVHVCSTGSDALKIVHEENILTMFLDLNMPGMNGLELCKKLRQMKPISCVYAVTGYSSVFELADCREAGFDDYFRKPVELSLLLLAAENSFQKLDRWKGKKGDIRVD